MNEESEEIPEKDPTKIIVGVILLCILLFGIVLYFKGRKPPQPSLENVTYNHFDFVKYRGHWYTDWQRGENVYQIPLRFNPYEVEDVPIIGRLDDDFSLDGEVYITFDPRLENLTFIALGAAELSQNIARALGLNPIASCIVNDTESCADRPIITCDEKNKSIIYIHHADTTKVLLKDSCVELHGPELDLLKSVDRFLYQWYGIMK